MGETKFLDLSVQDERVWWNKSLEDLGSGESKRGRAGCVLSHNIPSFPARYGLTFPAA